MNPNQETAQRILQEILEGVRELTEEAIRALIQEDPDAVVFLLIEQTRRLKEALAAQQTQKISTPSGMVPPYEKPAQQKKDQKRGRKPGHPGSGRKKNPNITNRIQHPSLERCPDCGGPVTPCQSESAKRTRVIEDIPANIEPAVTEHEIPRSYCPHCRKLVEPKIEDALPNATLGNRVLALSAHWHYGLGIPARQIADLLSGHLHTIVSLGGLFGMWQRLAGWLQPWCDQLIDELLESAVLHADETGWRVNGKTHWLWCFTNRDATFYMIHPSRGDPALFEFFRETFEGVLVSDFWACYGHINTTHQYCLAHLLRELKKVDGTNPSADWKEFSKKAKRLFGDALRLYHREGYDPSMFQSRIDRLHGRLIDLMLIQSADKDVKRIAARLEKYWDELLVFLTHPEVPPTNNHAEREIRPAVIMRKIIQGNQSEAGAKTQSILMTVFRTLKRRGYNPAIVVVDALKTAIRTGQLPPLPPPLASND